MAFNDKFSYATSQSAANDGKITINVYDGLTNVNKQINYDNIVPKAALIQFIKELKNKNIILGFNCSREKDSTLMAIWELYNENNVKIHRFY
jgi:recombinational DNA repair protein RecR